MTFDRLPERRQQRRIVVVVDKPGLYALREHDAPRGGLAREDVAFLHSGTNLEDADAITKSLERQGLLVTGSILVSSPYRDGDYASLDEASDRFGVQKWAAISTLCGLLGAASVEVKVVEDTLSDTRVEFSGGGQRGPISASAQGKSAHVKQFAGQLTWRDEFEGGAADIGRAEEHLLAWGLDADPEVRSLLEVRSNSANPLLRRTVTIDLSRESERTIDAALSLSVPMVLGLESTIKKAEKHRARYRVQFSVEFPSPK